MASKQPQITSDELSGLNNPCSSAFLALICFLEPFHRRKEGRKEGQNWHVDLRARTSPQVKIAPSIADICHLHRGLYISVTTYKLNVTVNGVTASEDVCIGYSTKHSVGPNMKIAKLWNTFFQPFNTENVNLTTTLFSKFHNADIMTIITSGELSEILEGSIGTALSVESARTVWLTGSLTRTFGMLMVWYIHISNNTLCFYLNQLN